MITERPSQRRLFQRDDVVIHVAVFLRDPAFWNRIRLQLIGMRWYRDRRAIWLRTWRKKPRRRIAQSIQFLAQARVFIPQRAVLLAQLCDFIAKLAIRGIAWLR